MKDHCREDHWRKGEKTIEEKTIGEKTVKEKTIEEKIGEKAIEEKTIGEKIFGEENFCYSMLSGSCPEIYANESTSDPFNFLLMSHFPLSPRSRSAVAQSLSFASNWPLYLKCASPYVRSIILH